MGEINKIKIKKNIKDLSETKQKILTGLDLVMKELIISQRRNNGELVFLKDENVLRIKASDLETK